MSKSMTEYAGATATPTMEAFADYLIAEVFEGKLPKGVDEASFRKGVALGGSLRTPFQKSEFWKADPRNYLANVEANRAAKAAEKAEKAKIAAEKAKARADKAIADAKALLAKAGIEIPEEQEESTEDAA